MFCINVGKFERLIRVLAGFVILYIGVLSQVEPKFWGYIGFIPIITGVLGWCPVYLPFKINTNK